MLKPHEYPVVGAWYLDLDQKAEFEIVATEDNEDLLEIQYFSGEIEELDIDTWFSMRVVAIAPPKDWSGPYEIDDKSEFPNLEEDIIHPENQNPPSLDSLD